MNISDIQLEIMKDYMLYLFHEISELYYGEIGWQHDLEYLVWDAMMREPNPAMLTDDERYKLLFAASCTDSWPVETKSATNPVGFISLAEWGERYTKWRQGK